MLLILLAMLVILAVAGLILVYVAYPHRGHQVPTAPWLGDAMLRGAEKLPVIDASADRFGVDGPLAREQVDSRR